MKKYINLFLVVLFFIISGCSIQIAGLNGAYQEPVYNSISEIAILKTASDNVALVSVDGQSISEQTIALKPGKHEMVLYVGKSNDGSDVNHMVVLTANFSANHTYFIKSKGYAAWIEDSHNVKISSVVSNMSVKKSIEL